MSMGQWMKLFNSNANVSKTTYKLIWNWTSSQKTKLVWCL